MKDDDIADAVEQIPVVDIHRLIHPRRALGIVRRQAGLRQHAVEVAQDRLGLVQHEPVMLQHRHAAERMPVLEHDGFMLYETQAILRYLDRVLPQPGLTPDDPKRAARMDQAMNVNDWYLFHGVGNVIIFHRVIAPRLMGRAPDEAAIEAAMPKAKTVFNELARLLGRASYFAGEEISLADMLLAPAVAFFTRTPEWSVLGAPHHHLVAWLSRMEARPSMQATTWERLTALVAQAA